jgi:Raf kinase inhibitor-like YbhB/YbcL family protein
MVSIKLFFSKNKEEGMENNYPELFITCNEIINGGRFPVKFTHRGGDISPEFSFKNLSPEGKSIAIIFDDLDHPMNHWIIWNIPAMHKIPGNLPTDNIIPDMGNATQRTRYRGPNPPKGVKHKYQFSIFILDCELPLKSNSTKQQLIKLMQGHIIQYGSIHGYFE